MSNAYPAHAEITDEDCGTAFNASCKGRYVTSTLRGMLDTGAYPCMRRNAQGLSDKIRVNIEVRVAKQGVGSVSKTCGKVILDDGSSISNTKNGLRTLVLPDFEHDLWSIYEIAKAGYTAIFDSNGAKLYYNDDLRIQGTMFAEEKVDHDRRQYYMSLPIQVYVPEHNEESEIEMSANVVSAIHKLSDAELVHGRCGHIGSEYMRRATQDSKYIIPSTPHGCADCSRAKGTSHKHCRIRPEERTPKKPGEYTVSDICGPFFPSNEGIRYAEIFLDEASFYVWVECYQRKSDHVDGLARAVVEFLTRSGRKMRVHRTDGCGTNRSKRGRDYYLQEKIRHEFSGAYDSNNNGRIENLIRTCQEGVRTSILKANVPPSLTSECYKWWEYTWNRLSIIQDPARPGKYCSRLNLIENHRIPFPIEWMREFGVSVHVKIADLSRYGGKHQNVPRAYEGVFIGYSAFGPNCYRIYDLAYKTIRDNVPKSYCTTFDDIYPFHDETLWPVGELMHRNFAFTHGDATDSENESDTIPADSYAFDIPTDDNREPTLLIANHQPGPLTPHTTVNSQVELTKEKQKPPEEPINDSQDTRYITPVKVNPGGVARQVKRLELLHEGRITRQRTRNDPPQVRVAHTKNRRIATQHLQHIPDDSNSDSVLETKRDIQVKGKRGELKVGTKIYAIDSSRDGPKAYRGVIDSLKEDGTYITFDADKSTSFGPYTSDEIYTNIRDINKDIQEKVTTGEWELTNSSANSADGRIDLSSIPRVMLNDPKSRKEAMESIIWPWLSDAEVAELYALKNLGTYSLVDPKAETIKYGSRPRLLRSKWVYKIKWKSDGELDKFKARLTACGYSQRYGIDYHDTHAYVTNVKILRMILQIYNSDATFKCEHWDVSNAFVNAPIDEVIYIAQPEGHAVPGKEDWILRLHKALYGTKQAANAWQKMVVHIMNKVGAKSIDADPATYTLEDAKGGFVIVGTHVDDFMVVFNPLGSELRNQIWKAFEEEVKITNTGEIHWALQTRIDRDAINGILKLSQGNYVRSLIEKYKDLGLKEYDTPVSEGDSELCDSDLPRTPMDKEAVAQFPFQEIVGSLRWLVGMTRPDIAVATQKAAKWATKGSIHLIHRLKRVLGYLKKYPDDGMVFTRPTTSTPILRQAADASLGDAEKGLSTLGNLEWFEGAAIGWHSNRSKRVALSTGESETMSLVKAGKTNIYLKDVIRSLPRAALKGTLGPTDVLEDNKSAVDLLSHAGKQKNSRHYGMEFYALRGYVNRKEINIVKVPTESNPADFFTKVLAGPKFHEFKGAIMQNHLFKASGEGLSHRDEIINAICATACLVEV